MNMNDHLRLLQLTSFVRAESRARASASLRAFAHLYLPHHLQRPDGLMHAELYDLLGGLPGRPGARVAVAAPRGHAKSTLVSLVNVLWSICHGHHRFIVLISDTADKAADFLDHVKHELVHNQRLAEDYPEVCEPDRRRPRPPRWRHHEIITHNQVKVLALGYGQNIRGRRHLESRPDLMILDDVESRDNTATAEARAKVMAWFNRSILKAGTPQTQAVVIGTIQHYDSLLARLTDPAQSPMWEGRIYRAVVQWSSRPELWERWADILHGRSDEDGGQKAARTFFEAHSQEMLADTAVLWPDVEDYHTLMLMRESEGPASFDSEKQNEPVNPQDCIFLEEDFRYWEDRWPDEQALTAAMKDHATFVGACDPSLGRQGRHADDSAIITLLRDKRDGTLYLLDADIARRRPDRIIDDVLAYARHRKYDRFGFETNQFQSFLADELKRRSNKAGVYLSVEDIHNTTDKLGRIQRLQPLIRSGALQFSRRHRTLLEQLRLFPKAAHDDGPDALEMAVTTAGKGPKYVPFKFEPAGRCEFAGEGVW